jgi:hypothetical protein
MDVKPCLRPKNPFQIRLTIRKGAFATPFLEAIKAMVGRGSPLILTAPEREKKMHRTHIFACHDFSQGSRLLSPRSVANDA